METKFDFNDILLTGGISSPIETRSSIRIYTEEGYLPIIVAPMDTVISEKNYKKFKSKLFHIAMPRGSEYEVGHNFHSIGLEEAKDIAYNRVKCNHSHLLIDIANGHMQYLVNLVKMIKHHYPLVQLMVGNIANPKMYTVLSDAGADYIRCGIGFGGGCLTAKQTGVGYAMGSLIKECYEESIHLIKPAKIVADGGFKDYSDIIKALALGADYVMIGSILNNTIESAGKNYLFGWLPVSQNIAEKLFKLKLPIYKSFRGMSTKAVQKEWGKTILKTSEGVTRKNKVKYTLEGWRSNFIDYLKSAMSYCGAKNLDEFIGECKFTVISTKSFERFNK